MYAMAPVAWPIAKLLDRLLGEAEEHTYKKAELKSFLQYHRTGEEPLREDEVRSEICGRVTQLTYHPTYRLPF